MTDDLHWADDDLDDREFPDDEDSDSVSHHKHHDHDVDDHDRDDDDTIVCTYCHALIFYDSEQCPHCGQYITPDTSVWSGRSWWWMALAALGIGGLIYVLLFFPAVG